MKKIFAIAIVVAGTLYVSAENILKDGGFEKGKDDWVFTQRLVTGNAVLDTEKKTEGQQSIRLEVTEKKKDKDSRQALQLASPKIAVTGGTELFYSFDLALENVTQGEKNWNICRIALDLYDADGKRIKGVDLAGGQGTVDWKKYTGKVNLPKNCAFVTFRLMLSDATGKIWVDNIILSTMEIKETE
ncbi:MAG: hypothetical protein LBM70_08320 [Victivallales bacterium]|jgi:hypothetical protein|nr:hypothetical protein [Victivallales bacterium]